jgi:hypothetical protein
MKFTVSFFGLLLLSAMGTVAAAQSPERFLSPPSDHGPATVKVWFTLDDISDIGDEEETFGFNGVLRLTWKDPRQTFDPVAAGVPEKIYQGAYQFDEVSPAWYPQIYLANESGGFETDAVTLRISPDGTSVLTTTINAVAKTRLSMRRFPFDAHTLKAAFRIPGFRPDEVVFVAEGTESDPQMTISQWNFGGIGINSDSEPSPGFTLDFQVTRDPMFTLRLVGLPLALIVVLSWSVFWMERSSLGDRISVSFVGILTAVAYQIVVGDLLPHVSYVTLMHGFLNFSFFIMCATVVVNLVVGACDRNGKAALGDIIDRRCRYLFPITYLGLLLLAAVIAFTIL